MTPEQYDYICKSLRHIELHDFEILVILIILFILTKRPVDKE